MPLGFQDNPGNILGTNTADNLYDSSSVAANADGSMIERQEYIQTQLAAMSSALPGNFAWGVAPAGTSSTTAVVIAALAGYGDDYFNDQYYMQVLKNADSAGNAPEPSLRKITDYVSATGTFTCDAFASAIGASDICLILHESIVAIGRDDADNIYASTNVVANADGSILERLEYIQGLVGGVDGTANVLGTNDADNQYDSSSVAANADGSALERLEYIQSSMATAAELSGTGIPSYPAAAAPANNVSIAEVLRDIWDALRNGTGGSEPGTNRSIVDEVNGAVVAYGAKNYIGVPITFAAGTTGAVATHEILTVTGAVRLRIFIECVTTVEGSGSLQLGVAGTTNAFIASTTGTDLAAGDIWIDATPAETYGNYLGGSSPVMLDKVVNALDVGYEVTADTLTAGAVTFHVWWEPLNSTGAVAAADGTGTL